MGKKNPKNKVTKVKEKKKLNSKTYDGSIPSNFQRWYLKIELYT
jgi:hypothetical protein